MLTRNNVGHPALVFVALILAVILPIGSCSGQPVGDPVCGDGVVDPGEGCDDGNQISGDGCSAACLVEPAPACGDGVVDPGEGCDDGNQAAGDGCSAQCQLETTCGDGRLDPGETCDDQNAVSGDGCSSTCLRESLCGDGVLDPGEHCDDGNTLAGDGCDPQCFGEGAAVADQVVAAPGQSDGEFGDPALAVNGVRGCGSGCGSVDVFALGYAVDEDNYLTLAFTGQRVLNGPGPDFVVFENAFLIGAGPLAFMDQAIVWLSRDGETWVVFPHDYQAPDESIYSRDPAHWVGFAGINPVRYHTEDNPVDPFDQDAAGGDAFDLSDLPNDGGEAEAIKREGFRYLRIVTAPSQLNPDTGDFFPRDPVSNGADIDGVVARYLVPDPE